MSRRRVPMSISLTIALVVALFAVFSTSHPAKADPGPGGCWCTQYVANQTGVTGFPNAWEWDTHGHWVNQSWVIDSNYPIYLQSQGWVEDTVPNAGDIMVVQPNIPIYVYAYGYWTTWKAGSIGHVAIIGNGTVVHPNGVWYANMQGANQGWGTNYWDSGCNNVSSLYFNTSGSWSGHYTFWYHP